MIIYVVGIATGHGCELTSGNCAYLDHKQAEDRVKAYHADGLTYIKMFTLYTQDKEETNGSLGRTQS